MYHSNPTSVGRMRVHIVDTDVCIDNSYVAKNASQYGRVVEYVGYAFDYLGLIEYIASFFF